MAAVISGPGALDWTVYAGDANRELFEFQVGDDPMDITGAILSAQARVRAPDVEVALTAECVIVTTGPGLATVAWDGEQVRALLGGEETWTGVWDLEILEVGETLPRTMVRGTFTAVLDVTRVTP